MDEDFILPDEDMPVETSQPEEEATPEAVEEPQTTEETPAVEEPAPVEQPKFKIKYNHEEQELAYDEAIPLIQKGMNYDKVQERLQAFETDPRLGFVEELAKEYGLPVDKFIEQVKAEREQAKLDELIQQNIPEEYAREMLANREFRQQMEAERQAKQEQEKQRADINAFREAYPDVKPEDIPDTVWQDVAEHGTSLRDAYTRHENQQLRNRLKVLEQNMANQQKAPVGSVTAHGGAEPAEEDDFLKGFNSY